MTDQIRQLKDQVNELASRIAGFDRIGEIVNLVLGGIVLAGLLTAWIAIGAGVLRLGRLEAAPDRRRRRDSTRTSRARQLDPIGSCQRVFRGASSNGDFGPRTRV